MPDVSIPHCCNVHLLATHRTCCTGSGRERGGGGAGLGAQFQVAEDAVSIVTAKAGNTSIEVCAACPKLPARSQHCCQEVCCASTLTGYYSIGTEGYASARAQQQLSVTVEVQDPHAVQVSANGTHIDCFTEAMVDLSDLTLDVMTYRVIKRLTTLKQR